MNSSTLQTIAGVDAIGRFIGNVGVPAAIAFLVLWQVTPRLDQQTIALQQLNTAVAVQSASCGLGRALDR
jgi:hypothetical protein